MGEELSASGTKQPRGQDRDSLLLLATMRVADRAETQRIKVRNLSPGGMMAESPQRTVCGERLMIELRNIGWIGGTVAWVADNRFGVVFDQEVDCKAVRQPVTSSVPVRGIYGRRPHAWGGEPAPEVDPGKLRRI